MTERDGITDVGRDRLAAPDHDATLVFEYDDARRATVVAESVRREIGEIDDDRSRTRLSRRDRTVEIAVRARDLTALRAAINTWFTLVEVAERVHERGRRAAGE